MRRVGLILVVIVMIGGAAFGAFRYGYQQGETSGQATASSDRTAFFGTRSALPAGGGGFPRWQTGASGTGASPGARGGPGGAETTPGPAGALAA